MDGQTDMMKPIVSFPIFANEPKNSQYQSLSWLRVKLEMNVDLPDYSEIYVGLHIIFSNTGLHRVQVVPVHALKLYRWSKGTTAFISNLCARHR
jgi:hypothetical protein